MPPRKKPVERLKELIKEMDTLMGQLSEWGAGDSEPDAEFQHALVQAARRGVVEVPQSASAWQMFADMTGAGKAARRMTSKATKIAKWVTRNDRREVIEYIRDYCWRISF
jgi:hypothetical protein